MKAKFVFLSIFTILFLSFISLVQADGENIKAAPLTLADCYNLALKQSEKIAINAEQIKEAEARFSQSLGTLMPHIYFNSTKNWQDTLDSGGSSLNASGNALEQKFTFQQTLFSGFKEFAAMKASKLQESQYLNEKIRAEQLLLVDVANSFYLLLEQRADLRSLEWIKESLKERIRDLMEREKLGRSRRSEVVNTESELYGVEADIELLKNRMILARQLLEFLTGVTVSDIADTEDLFPVLGPEESYLQESNERPDVLATKSAWEVSQQNTKVAKSGLLPTVTAEGNIYTHRVESLESSKWDAALKVSVPIFEGTEVYGLIQEAAIKAAQAELEYKHTKRLAYAHIRDAYVRIQTALPRTMAFKKALKASEMNYALQRSDYKLNLVNNLDVLAAIKTLENSRRDYIHAYYETKRSYWQLVGAVGKVRAEEIK
jgi:outer membrane protein